MFTACAFGVYDHLVEQRQSKILATAKGPPILLSLFPKEVGKRLIEEAKNEDLPKCRLPRPRLTSNRFFPILNWKRTRPLSKPSQLPTFSPKRLSFADIVDLQPEFYARAISGLYSLENIYHEFDVIAKRRRVSKVETIG
jgi:hypothetical protein